MSLTYTPQRSQNRVAGRFTVFVLTCRSKWDNLKSLFCVANPFTLMTWIWIFGIIAVALYVYYDIKISREWGFFENR